MKRRLLNLVTLLSLMLCAVTAVFWGRSYSHTDGVRLWRLGTGPDGRVRYSQLTAGTRAAVVYLGAHWWAQDRTDEPRVGVKVYSMPSAFARWDAGFNPGTVRWHVGRLAWVADPPAADGWGRTYFVTLPAWLPTAALAAAPAAWLYRRKRRADGPGRCRACGYDLTGNVSGVCPECGNVAERVRDGTGIP